MAVATVEVLALLAVGVLAGAAAECDGQWPLLVASTGSQRRYRPVTVGYSDITIPYGEDLSLFCHAKNINNFRIRNSKHDFQTQRLNWTTIHYVDKTPNLGTHSYYCTSETGCQRVLWIAVCLAITVNLPSIRHNKQNSKFDEYFVALGEHYEIICQGNGNEPISIKSSTRDGFQTKALNRTTVNYKALADRADTLTFWCSSSSSKSWKIILILDHYPEARRFRCIFNDNKFKCTWLSSSKSNIFKLFHKDKSGHTRRFCTDSGSEATRTCSWNRFSWQYDSLKMFYDYSFLLESCCQFVCHNKTFFTNINLVKVLSPLTRLKVFNTSSRGDVVISWFHDHNAFYLDYVYKVEYRLLAMAWQEADLSPVQCDNPYSTFILDPGVTCKTRISLPCPRSPYEIKVYFKLPGEDDSTGNPWSEPTSLHILTPPRTDDITLYAECRAELKEPDRINSADRALNKVARLLSHTIENNVETTKKLSGLEKKRARVKALRESAAART